MKLVNNTNIPSELNNGNETLMDESNHHPGISSSPARTRKIPKPVKKRLQSAVPYNKPQKMINTKGMNSFEVSQSGYRSGSKQRQRSRMSRDNQDISNLNLNLNVSDEKEKTKKPIQSARNKNFINQLLVSRQKRQEKTRKNQGEL